MRAFGSACTLFGFVAAVVLFLVTPPSGVASAAGDLTAVGERLYRDGIGVSGAPVKAFDRSGQAISGPASQCVSCHRPSGYGSNEGSVYVPPVTGPTLFAPRVLQRAQYLPGMFQQVQPPEFTSQLNSAHPRPAYNDVTLGRLLRQGLDASGAPIAAAMPRYRLSSADVEALAAYLKSLSAHPDPGVDGKAIRFAVIVSDRTPPGLRKAVIETAQAFVAQENRGVSADRSRRNFSPFYRTDLEQFWRMWTLDVWDLHGPEATWPRQLEAHYSAAPVFAVASSAVPGPWAPIGRFCDQKRLPCLFPLTDLPAEAGPTPGYTVYLSGGLPLEARAMSAYLARGPTPSRVVQVISAGPRGAAPAKVLATELRNTRRKLAVDTIVVPNDGAWGPALKGAAAGLGKDDVLALWPGDEPATAVAALREVDPPRGRILLASAAEAAAKSSLTGDLATRVRIIHPSSLPTAYEPHAFRIRQWLNARGVALTPPEPQYLVYYSLSVLEKAVMEIQGAYSRDYLLEHIETVAESNLNPGVYPYLSLGPGQRTASRGSYVVRLDPSAPGSIRADGDWIVP